jgi:hypothetical protein
MSTGGFYADRCVVAGEVVFEHSLLHERSWNILLEYRDRDSLP